MSQPDQPSLFAFSSSPPSPPRAGPGENLGLAPGKVVEVPLSEIDEADTTFEFRINPDVTDLKADLSERGQQFPVLLRVKRGRARLQLVSGFRRLRAARELGWKTLRAIVRRDLDDDEAFRISLIENEQRHGLTGLDRANAVARLRSWGKNDPEICSLFGIGERQLRRLDRGARMPSILREAVGEQRLPLTHALLLDQAARAMGKGFDLARWIQQINLESLSVAELARRLGVETHQSRVEKKAGRRQRLMEIRGSGFRLHPISWDPQKSTPEQKRRLAEILRKALGLLES